MEVKDHELTQKKARDVDNMKTMLNRHIEQAVKSANDLARTHPNNDGVLKFKLEFAHREA